MSKKSRRGKSSRATSVTASEPEAAVEVGESAQSELPPPDLEATSEAAEAAAAQDEAIPGTVDAPPEELPPVRERADSRDDCSYPPVDLDTHFFDGTDRNSDPDLDHEEHDPRMRLKRTPEVAARRAEMQKYVKIAVAAASALCLAAVVKVSLARGHGDDSPRPSSASVTAVAPPAETAVPQAAPPAPAPRPVAETQAAAAPAPAPAPSAPPPADTTTAKTETAPPPAAPPAASTAEATPAPAADAPPAQPDPVAAAKAKTASRNFLERGKNADAIEAGEKSVALDPTDGEAWLILGAAYQAKGDMKNARRSYKACIEEGKRGPRGECMAMPH